MMNGEWGLQVGMAALVRNRGFLGEARQDVHGAAAERRRTVRAAVRRALQLGAAVVGLALRAVASA